MTKEGNEKIPSYTKTQSHNPIPTSLFCCLFVVNALGKEKSKNILTSNCLHEIHCGRERNKDVYRDGVMNDFVPWCRYLLVSFLFHAVTSLHPPSFHRNNFSTCSTNFLLGLSPAKIICCVDILYAHAQCHVDNAPSIGWARTTLNGVSGLPWNSPHDLP